MIFEKKATPSDPHTVSKTNEIEVENFSVILAIDISIQELNENDL